MTILFQGNERNYPAGEDRSVSIPVEAGPSRIIVTLTRVNWPDIGVPVVEAMLEISLDGGQTWPARAGFTAYGGQSMRDGVPFNISSVNCPLPEPSNPNRMVRAVVSNPVPLRTAITVEVV